MGYLFCWRFAGPTCRSLMPKVHVWMQSRDLAAISPTGTGKTLSYLLPTMVSLDSPNSNSKAGLGVRAVILAPTRELAHQIHNECLKLAQGRKWRIVLFSKATAVTLADKSVRDKVGKIFHLQVDIREPLSPSIDILISTPLRLVSSLQKGHLDLNK